MIHDNQVGTNSQATNATYDNIQLDTTTLAGTIQGNRCYRGDEGAKPRYGIRVNSVACEDNFIANNVMNNGGATADFSDAGTRTITSGNVPGITYIWSPAIQGTVSNPTIAYTANNGRYAQEGPLVFFHLDVVINTISGGSGNVRITLPKTNRTGNAVHVNGLVMTTGVDLVDTPVMVVGTVIAGQAYLDLYVGRDNTSKSALPLANLAAGDEISVSGCYFVA
jgi:hypothetical protein